MLLSQGHGEVIKGDDDDDNTKPESQDWKEARNPVGTCFGGVERVYNVEPNYSLNPGSDNLLAT